MNELELLLQEQTKAQKQAEMQRMAMLEDQLMRELSLAKDDPSVNLAPMAAIVEGNAPLVASMQQSAGQQMDSSAQNEAGINKLYADLVGNTGSGNIDPSLAINTALKQEELNLKKQQMAQNATGPGLNLTPGQKRLDESYAKRLDEYRSKDRDVATGNISLLREAHQALEENPDLSGGLLRSTVPVGLRGLYDKQARDIEDNVAQVTMQNLRATIGAQFTEKESFQFQRLAYDPKQPAEVNQERLRKKMEIIQKAVERKDRESAYFEENGTLVGYVPDFIAAGYVDIPKQKTKVGGGGPSSINLINEANADGKKIDLNELSEEELDAKFEALGLK